MKTDSILMTRRKHRLSASLRVLPATETWLSENLLAGELPAFRALVHTLVPLAPLLPTEVLLPLSPSAVLSDPSHLPASQLPTPHAEPRGSSSQECPPFYRKCLVAGPRGRKTDPPVPLLCPSCGERAGVLCTSFLHLLSGQAQGRSPEDGRGLHPL